MGNNDTARCVVDVVDNNGILEDQVKLDTVLVIKKIVKSASDTATALDMVVELMDTRLKNDNQMEGYELSALSHLLRGLVGSLESLYEKNCIAVREFNSIAVEAVAD